jgi:hypothetical protein
MGHRAERFLGIVTWGILAAAPAAVGGAERPDPYDEIVHRFIEWDVGRLPGPAGQKAREQFAALHGAQCVPALVRGVNRAAHLSASCPIMALSAKLTQVLSQIKDPKTLEYVVRNLDRPGPGMPYGQYLESLRRMIQERLGGPVALGDELALKPGDPVMLRVRNKPISQWDYHELVKMVEYARDSAQLQVLEELKNRKGSEYTDALAHAIARVPDPVKPAARGMLGQRLARMSEETLRAKLKDPDDEIRAAAASAVGYRGLPLYRELAAALRDRSPLVATTAHDVLVKLLGEDLGPPPNATGVQWFEASKAWEDRIDKNQPANR